MKTFKVEKKKLFRRAFERWQTIGTASPQTEAWSAFFEQHSTSTVKSQCATEQLGPQGLIMDTKYGKKAMIGRNKLWRAMKRCDSRGRTRYYWLSFAPLPDVLPVVAWSCLSYLVKEQEKAHTLSEKNNKIWKFGRFSTCHSL